MIRGRMEQLMASFKELLEPVGGDKLLTLLDLLAQLNPVERNIILSHFQKCITHILGGDSRFLDELSFLAQESSASRPSGPLLNDFTKALAGQRKRRVQHRFSVIDGGKVQ